MSGWANEYWGGTSGLAVEDAAGGDTSGHSQVLLAGAPIRVRHTYRRVMDWDVEPTAFSEYVTIQSTSFAIPDSLTFRYGAASDETTALEAASAVGAQLYSLAQPDVPDGQTTGEPNSFVWAYRSPDTSTTTTTSTTTSTSTSGTTSMPAPTGSGGTSPQS